MPFIFLEPSCASVFKDELLELFPNDPRAQRLSRQVWLLADWLAAKAPDSCRDGSSGSACAGARPLPSQGGLRRPGKRDRAAATRGCERGADPGGLLRHGRPFGFEADKFEVSKTIASDGLLPAVDSRRSADTCIVADGFSCREQIQQLGHKQAIHFAELLARSCGCG